MGVKSFILGPKYFRYRIYDTAMSFFDHADFVSQSMFSIPAKKPEDFDHVFKFLESERLIEILPHGFQITEKGKCMRRSGGFVRQLAIERIKFFSILIGIIASVAAIIALFVE